MFMAFASFTYYPPPLLEHVQNQVPASASSLEPSYHRAVRRQSSPTKPAIPSLRRRSIKSLSDLKNRVVRPATSMPSLKLKNPFRNHKSSPPMPSLPQLLLEPTQSDSAAATDVDDTLLVTGPQVTGPRAAAAVPPACASENGAPASCSASGGGVGDTNTSKLVEPGDLLSAASGIATGRASSPAEKRDCVDATEELLPLLEEEHQNEVEVDDEVEQRTGNHSDINRNLNPDHPPEDFKPEPLNSAASVTTRLARKLSMTIPLRFSTKAPQPATDDTPDERTRLPHRLRKAMSFTSQPAIAIPQAAHSTSEPEEMVMTPTNESSGHEMAQFSGHHHHSLLTQGYATLVNPPTMVEELSGDTTAAGSSTNHSRSEEDSRTAAAPSGEPHDAEAEPEASDAEEEPPTGDRQHPYSIRLTPFVDHSTTMPGFYIGPVERKARNGTLIRVGRYTDRKDTTETTGDNESTPIVFKSKVVSRSHAEFFVDKGQWYVRDVKSSSGTFLNHMRLSPAGQPSEPHAISDGDVIQFGMDYRGGSEELYKCVKVHLELNQSWKKKANQFNVQALDNLRDMVASRDLQECAICLLPVSPLQALFIAPCSHAWHYKCIRPLIIKPYPHFLCPNCRTVCDLEADIEVPDLSHLNVEDPPKEPQTNDD
ncbi:hypothetical protein TRVA0_010S02542 [Trichomonascus vanleenenianus]|uniref:uncharacterized protein n=1 Tax=Trichomonascus vanleenenianus TaxID=2268995 RepID=UPI003EC9A10F